MPFIYFMFNHSLQYEQEGFESSTHVVYKLQPLPISKITTIYATTTRTTLSPQSHSGTKAPTLLQKSHLRPLPPSQASASTNSKLFLNPAPPNSSISPSVDTKVAARNGVPPLSFKLSCHLFPSLQGGQSVAALVVNVELGPFAMAGEMDGSPRVTKLPQMVMKALVKAGL